MGRCFLAAVRNAPRQATSEGTEPWRCLFSKFFFSTSGTPKSKRSFTSLPGLGSQVTELFSWWFPEVARNSEFVSYFNPRCWFCSLVSWSWKETLTIGDGEVQEFHPTWIRDEGKADLETKTVEPNKDWSCLKAVDQLIVLGFFPPPLAWLHRTYLCSQQLFQLSGKMSEMLFSLSFPFWGRKQVFWRLYIETVRDRRPSGEGTLGFISVHGILANSSTRTWQKDSLKDV